MCVCASLGRYFFLFKFVVFRRWNDFYEGCFSAFYQKMSAVCFSGQYYLVTVCNGFETPVGVDKGGFFTQFLM